MALNTIDSRGTWGNQAEKINANFNNIYSKANTAITVSEAAVQAIATLQGFAGLTEQQVVATLTAQISENSRAIAGIEHTKIGVAETSLTKDNIINILPDPEPEP